MHGEAVTLLHFTPMKSFLARITARPRATTPPRKSQPRRSTPSPADSRRLHPFRLAQPARRLANFAAIQAVGNAVIAANQTAIAATTPGGYTYPGVIKSEKARKSYDDKMVAFNRILRDSNATLSVFTAPADMDVASINLVDSYIHILVKAIEAHHVTRLNIR